MEERESQGPQVERAEVNLCIFPHLKEFLAIDLRRGLPGRPYVRQLSTDDVLNEGFYQEVKDTFSTLLEDREHPFANLIALPPRVEMLVRQRSLAAILRVVNPDTPVAPVPQVAVLLCTPAVVRLSNEQLAAAIQHFLGEAGAGVVQETLQHMKRLVAQERTLLSELEREHMRQAILGQDQDFFTLWERPE